MTGCEAALVLMAGLAQEPPGCWKCHEKERAAEAVAAHARPAASCVECHGGDPKETDKERAHAKGFTGRIAKADVPALCARCHSDARRMNPYGLPTDQLAQYLTSKHGESAAQGKTGAAGCADCHGTHGILRARDPRSPVHPSKVAATCGKCHSDRALMEKLGHSWDAEARYREGVHGKLLEKGDAAGPHCATCHGNHGAAPPGFREVGQVCGKCHARQREFFEASPHAFYARDGSFKGCVACHANHRIVSEPREVARRCTPCHEAPDAEMKKFAGIGDALASARGGLAGTEGRLARMARAGFATDDEQLLLEQVRTSMLQLPPLQHALDAGKVEAGARDASARLAEIEGRLDRKEREERLKKLALVPIWVFLGAMAWIFRAKRRHIERPK